MKTAWATKSRVSGARGRGQTTCSAPRASGGHPAHEARPGPDARSDRAATSFQCPGPCFSATRQTHCLETPFRAGPRRHPGDVTCSLQQTLTEETQPGTEHRGPSWPPGEKGRGDPDGAVEGTLFCRAQSIDRKDVIDQPRFHLRRRGNLENQSQRLLARTPRRNIPRRGEKGPRAGGRARRSRAESGSLARGVGSCQHLGPVLCAEQGRMSVCLKKKKIQRAS